MLVLITASDLLFEELQTVLRPICCTISITACSLVEAIVIKNDIHSFLTLSPLHCESEQPVLSLQ